VLGCDAAFDDAGAFGFEKAALEAGKGLADDDTSACGDNAMPGDTLTARAGGHGSAGGTSAAREAHSQGQLAVCGDAAFGDAFDEGVESLPGGVHAVKIAAMDASCQTGGPLTTHREISGAKASKVANVIVAAVDSLRSPQKATHKAIPKPPIAPQRTWQMHKVGARESSNP
jgi:hypothetical protein